MTGRSIWVGLILTALTPTIAMSRGREDRPQGRRLHRGRRYAKMNACFTPTANYARGRVYFRPEGTPTWYYVDMKSDQPCVTGILPRPGKKLIGKHVEYYLEGQNKALRAVPHGRVLTHRGQVRAGVQEERPGRAVPEQRDGRGVPVLARGLRGRGSARPQWSASWAPEPPPPPPRRSSSPTTTTTTHHHGRVERQHHDDPGRDHDDHHDQHLPTGPNHPPNAVLKTIPTRPTASRRSRSCSTCAAAPDPDGGLPVVLLRFRRRRHARCVGLVLRPHRPGSSFRPRRRRQRAAVDNVQLPGRREVRSLPEPARAGSSQRRRRRYAGTLRPQAATTTTATSHAHHHHHHHYDDDHGLTTTTTTLPCGTPSVTINAPTDGGCILVPGHRRRDRARRRHGKHSDPAGIPSQVVGRDRAEPIAYWRSTVPRQTTAGP